MKTAIMLLTSVFAFAPVLAGERHSRDSDSDSEHNIRHVNSSIHLDDGARAEELHTVNGSIKVGDHAEFTFAKTVNGSVTIGEDSRGKSLTAVNGRLVVGKRSVISGDITTVNGRVNLEEDAVVEGIAKNVNSDVTVAKRAHIGGQLITSNGDITLEDGARVDGGIRVRRSDSWWGEFFGSMRRIPLITIGPGAQVGGELVFEHEVELRVHSTAKIGRVSGATVKSY